MVVQKTPWSSSSCNNFNRSLDSRESREMECLSLPMLSRTFLATLRKRPILRKRPLCSGSSAENTAEVIVEPKTVAGVPSTSCDLQFVVSNARAGTVMTTYCATGFKSGGTEERDTNSAPMD